MNERDIERRLRDVVEGRQPPAPESLHRFLREMPESEADRRLGPIGRVRWALARATALVPPQPFGRQLRLAAGLALAVLIGLGGGAVLIDLRQTPAAPVATESLPVIATPRVTPPRSMSAPPSPAEASLGLKNLTADGLAVANRGMALPTTAIVTRSGEYLGVTDSTFGGASGASGVVHSGDGLFWDWSPPTEIDPQAAILTSIASDNLDTIVVTGGAQGMDGVTDGRIWVSVDDGATWQEVADESAFKGITVQVVVHGAGQFVALGWNDVSSADTLRPVAEWQSVDGLTWTRVTSPIKGTAAVIVPTAAGFLLSGTPLTSGAIDEPPMWHSPDGVTWTRSKASDNTAQLIGPLVSATVTARSHVYAISTSNDGWSHALAASADGGLTWSIVKPDASLPSEASISHVASLNSHDPQYGDVEYLFATLSQGGPNVYVSTDGGVTWKMAQDAGVGGPTGTTLLELGSGYLAGKTRILSFGVPGTGLGIWRIDVPPGT